MLPDQTPPEMLSLEILVHAHGVHPLTAEPPGVAETCAWIWEGVPPNETCAVCAAEGHGARHGAPTCDRIGRASPRIGDRQRRTGSDRAPSVTPDSVIVSELTERLPGFEIVYVPHIGKPVEVQGVNVP